MGALKLEKGASINTLGYPSMALNLSGVVDWETPRFIDRARQARGWGWSGNPSNSVDQMGNLIQSGAGNTRTFFVHSDGTANTAYRGGTFRLTWEGSGNASSGTGAISGLTGSGSTRTFNLDGTGGNSTVEFIDIDWLNPPRNVKIIRTDLIGTYDAGGIFDPDMVSMISGFDCLRFMDWQVTNGSNIVNFADYPTMAWQNHGRVPLEAMVSLCNQLSCDGWFCIPHQATDDFIVQFSTYVRDHLRADLVARFEYSNEVWNFGGAFTQSLYAIDKALADWGASGGTAWVQWQGKRSTQMVQIIKSVYGAKKNCRFVLGGQAGNSGIAVATLTSPLWQTNEPASYVSPHTVHDEWGIGGYFYANQSLTTLPVMDWLAVSQAHAKTQLLAAIDQVGFETRTQSHVTVAKTYGLNLVCYEANNHLDINSGGTNLMDGAGVPKAGVLELFETTCYSSEMAAIHDAIRSKWVQLGGTLWSAFVDCSGYSKYGAWGNRRYRTDTNPIDTGLRSWNSANPRWWIK